MLMDMNELNKLPVSKLKQLLKTRAGRIAELQIEIKVISAIIDQKVMTGDIGTAKTKVSKKKEKPTESPQSKIKTSSSDHAFEEID